MIRTLALRVLREILSKQPWRFKNYAELTIMKALESHKDPHKEVRLSTPTLICSLRSWFYHKALSDHEAVVRNTPLFYLWIIKAGKKLCDYHLVMLYIHISLLFCRWFEQLRRRQPCWRCPSVQTSVSRCCVPLSSQLITQSTWPPSRCRPKWWRGFPAKAWLACCPRLYQDWYR